MTVGLILPLGCLFFSGLLLVVYFARKRIDNYENKIYKGLLVVNFVSLIMEFVNTFFSIHYIPILSDFIIKFYLLILTSYMLLLTLYLSYVSKDKKQIETKWKKTRISYIIIFAIFAIFMLICDIKVEMAKLGALATGTSVNLLSILSSLCPIAWIYNIIITKNKGSRKKFIPFIVYLTLSLFVMAIQVANPGILLITPAETLVVMLMFFTIENPDIKMISQLDAAKDQADKANRAKTDFLSSMSHEIRTPLNAIVGFSDYIMSSDSLDEAKENAQDIVHASKTLLEIVNGILDISKIEAGKLEIINSKYNAKQTFEGLAKLITPKMQEKGLDFSYYIAPDLPDTLFGDHANLKKIITNLLSNAYKYTDKGSVRYEVNCINSNNISKLIITVEDTGRGIKQESIDKLFTKFQRLDEDRNTTIEGTGLGLAITKQLIELMGGKILVHTVYGEGSKFTVILNQSIEKTPIIEEKVDVKTTLDLKDKKILLVDDNALNIKVATKILERFNANNITSLDSGFACLELIESGKKFDIILLDDMMPKMSGVETFHKLKEIEGFNQPVVILTANAITGMKEKYLKEGFEDYLAKPIEKDELIRVCNTVFQKYGKSQPTPPEEDKIELLDKIENVVDIEPFEHTEVLDIIEDEPMSKESYLRENNVDLDKALELLGDIEMYNMTMSDFLSEVESKWNNIITYKNNADMENYAIEVHSLKSDAKYLGFTSLADISYQHELKSKENDNDFIQTHFKELETEYNKALSIAKTYNEM